MSYKRQLVLLRLIEDSVSVDVEYVDAVIQEDVRDAVQELRKLIDANKPEPRWSALPIGLNADGEQGVFDGTLGPDADPIYTAVDAMAADVIVQLLNEAEERAES